MKTIYFDLGMGAAGDMLTAALLELHPDPGNALDRLNRVFGGKAVISAQREQKNGIAGTHVTVNIGGKVEEEKNAAGQEHTAGTEQGDHAHHHHHHHTSVSEVRDFISGLDLPERVIRDGLEVYDLIAEAEAHVHGRSMENIHFHEVGTLDAMADVVSVCFLIRELAPDRICASPVHVGSGTVHCAHGELPVPAPATLELLKGIPFYSGEIRGELCTPTGAALLRHFVTEFGQMPVFRVSGIGYGIGTRDFPRANALRVLLGETEGKREQILELSCNIDDMTAEELAFAQERLLNAGALDVTFTDIGMKKSRPGVMLTCMCRTEQRDEMLRCMFQHTTSLGIREYVCNRYTLDRCITVRETAYGPVRVKRAEGYGAVREKPEFEDLRSIAETHQLSLRQVAAALREAAEAVPEEGE